MYIHDGPDVYRTADDKLVPEGDPEAAFLVVAAGGKLSDEDAQKYGLLKAADKPAPSQNKAQPAPASTKGSGVTIYREPTAPTDAPEPDADADAAAASRRQRKD